MILDVPIHAIPLFVDWPLADVWGSAVGFIAVMVIVVGAIGMASKTLSVAMMGGYLTFSYYAATSGITVLETTSYVTHTLVVVGMAFKLWRTEASIGGGG